MQSKAFKIHPISLKSNCKHQDYSEQQEVFFFVLFFLAFEDTPPSISPQLPLKHNRCLPTRLPSTSCLVTGSPLLSTTERLTNSMSGLNLETPLIHPPHWIDRSWLHRGRRSPTVACLIFTLGTAFLVLKSKAASYYKQRSPITSVPRWKKWFILVVICRLHAADYNQSDVIAADWQMEKQSPPLCQVYQ